MKSYRLFLAITFLSTVAFSQDNQWVTVTPTFNTPAKYPGATLSDYNGWASLKYDSGDSAVLAWRMILDTRRHNGIYANSIVLWRLKNNRLDLVTASNYAGGTYDPAPSFTLMPEFAADTTPCPKHPYDAMAYVDSLHAVYMLLGATPRIINFEASPVVTPQDVWDAHEADDLSTWKYSFAAGRWRRIPQNIRRFWPSPYYCGSCVPFHDNHLVYWKSAYKLLFVDLYGTHAATMNLTTEVWDTIALANTSPVQISSALTAWDSKRERMVIRTGDTVCCFDPATRRFTLLPNCGLDQDSNRAMYTGIAYIPKHDVYLAVGRNGTTRVFNTTAQTWSTVASGDIGLDAGEGNLQMEYDPATDKVVLSTAASGKYGGYRTFHYAPVQTHTRGAMDAGKCQSIKVNVQRHLSNAVISINASGYVPNTPLRIALYDASGRIVKEALSSKISVELNTSGMNAGIYLLRIRMNGKTIQKSIVLCNWDTPNQSGD